MFHKIKFFGVIYTCFAYDPNTTAHMKVKILLTQHMEDVIS